MPPKVKFESEDIVDAAFAIVCEHGFAALTARSVAERLGASVAPIYANFANLEELTAAVVQRAYSLSGEILARQQGEDIFANIGKASLELARLYPVLFREMALNPALHSSSYADMEQGLVKLMGESAELAEWSLSERRMLLLKMRIFHLGLSLMAANGDLPQWLGVQGAEELLFEAGADFVAMGQSRREGVSE
jgi:AcrR family transcriptional regulator